ncbi:MAG TPA: O-antigen ligase domain-containing protein [Candidatus Portnoybacteria bacterium]|nr:O-antigen ligase domain-containing protein [Candidatus Portnoybacteria bacterium]
MKKITPLKIVFLFELIIVILISTGVLPREAALTLTGVLLFYIIFSSLEDSLVLFIASIPLYLALPVTDAFDSMANWRILLAVLFLGLIFKQGLSIRIIKDKLGNLKIKEKFKHYLMECLAGVFLVIAVLSLFVATDLMVGIKKILFLINIFLLYIIVRNLARNRKTILRIIKAGTIAGVISLTIGYWQLISIFLTPLYNFWQWWAKNVISAFYGIDLSKLLVVSNTWFSYYLDSPPTLRMFSIFPDSHSFALFTIIGLIFLSYLLVSKIHRNKFINFCLWLAVILSFLALVFSGSRGVWLSGAIPFLIAVFLLLFKKIRESAGYTASQLKPFAAMLMIFILAFPISSLIISQSYQGTDGTLAFKRARTLTDLEELSVKTRIGIWQTSFKSVLKNPILGVGIGNYPVVLGEDISAAKRGASAHNLYLDVASEMGLLGLIVLLLMFWQILRRSIKNHNQFSYIFTFFFSWVLIYSLFDVVLLNDKVLLLFMVALGLLYSIADNYELKTNGKK